MGSVTSHRSSAVHLMYCNCSAVHLMQSTLEEDQSISCTSDPRTKVALNIIGHLSANAPHKIHCPSLT